jgi:hypothetical protein
MPGRSKRTYNLSESTVRHPQLAGEYGTFRSQDQVVDIAVERLYIELARGRGSAVGRRGR